MQLLALPGIHYAAFHYGPAWLKSKAVDAKFDAGHWGRGESKALAEIVASHAVGGDILVLGCGSNSLGKILPYGSFRTLSGVDLSPRAIALAWGNRQKSQYFRCGDMEELPPTRLTYRTIILPESIYYLPLPRAMSLLWRYASLLAPRGRFIVTICEPTRFAQYFEAIHENFRVEMDRQIEPGKERQVIVFAP